MRNLTKILFFSFLSFLNYTHLFAQEGITLVNSGPPPNYWGEPPVFVEGKKVYIQIVYRFAENTEVKQNVVSLVKDKNMLIESFSVAPSTVAGDTCYWDISTADLNGFFGAEIIFSIPHEKEKAGLVVNLKAQAEWWGQTSYKDSIYCEKFQDGDTLIDYCYPIKLPVYGTRTYTDSLENRLSVCDPYLSSPNATMPDNLSFQRQLYRDTAYIAENEGRYLLELADKQLIICQTTNIANANALFHNREVWLTKTDSAGKKLWGLRFYEPNNDYFVAGLRKYSDSSFIIFGLYSSTPYPPGNPYPDKLSIWIAKFDASGNILWEKGRGLADKLRYAIVDLQIEKSTGDIGILHYDASGFGITRLDGAGNVLKTATINEPFNTGAIAFKRNGNYLVIANSNASQRLLEITTTGDIVNNKLISYLNEGELTSITAAAGEGYILTGHFTESIMGECLSAKHSDAWVLKIAENGTTQWTGFFGGSGDERPLKSFALPNGNILVAANSSSTNGNISHPFSATQTSWIFMLGKDGNLVWEKSVAADFKYGTDEEVFERLCDIALLKDGSIAGIGSVGLVDVVDYLFKMKAVNVWLGTISPAWENAANWSRGTLPDEHTDVVIKAATPNMPIVNASTAVRSIVATGGAKVTVKAGVVLRIAGK